MGEMQSAASYLGVTGQFEESPRDHDGAAKGQQGDQDQLLGFVTANRGAIGAPRSICHIFRTGCAGKA